MLALKNIKYWLKVRVTFIFLLLLKPSLSLTIRMTALAQPPRSSSVSGASAGTPSWEATTATYGSGGAGRGQPLLAQLQSGRARGGDVKR